MLPRFSTGQCSKRTITDSKGVTDSKALREREREREKERDGDGDGDRNRRRRMTDDRCKQINVTAWETNIHAEASRCG